MVSKPWWNVAVPHRDIREGRLDESVFAAKLGDVLRSRGSLEYRDPETFFRKTHLTPGLRRLCAIVVSKLSGGKGEAFIQLQTPFGGGKTHALIALYHLFKNSETISGLEVTKSILHDDDVKQIPQAKVAAFVGTEVDAIRGLTPWGEIAKQLGSYSLVEEHDKKRVSPGTGILVKLLEDNKPVLILIDELLEYAVKAAAVNLKDVTGAEGTLKGQLSSFLQELSEAVTTVDRCVVIATLPSSILEHYDEAAEQTLMQLQKISGRAEAIYTPVEGEEVYEVIRKRLFDELGDPKIHRAVADEYFDIYSRLGEEVPSEYREEDYKRKIAKAYPFHPEIIDKLYERWSTFATFQRTRGVLRFLAEVVSDLYRREYPASLIQPSHINLDNSIIRTELVKHIGNQFEGVIASDITGPNANAPRIDRGMASEYSKFKVATGLATAVFFNSFSAAAERKGISVQRLRVAFLREGIPFPIVGDAMKRLENELYFLHSDKSLYYFLSSPNINRIIIDKEEAVKEKEEDIEQEIRDRIQKIAGSQFETIVWPRNAADISESKKTRLVILRPTPSYGDPTLEELINELLKKTSVGFRAYQNTLLLLAADSNEYDALRKNVCRLLALKAIEASQDLMKSLSGEDKQALFGKDGRGGKLGDADSAVSVKTLMTYQYLIKAYDSTYKLYPLGIPTIGEKTDISLRVRGYLEDQDLLLEKVSPKVVLEKVFEKGENEKPYQQVWEAFLRYPQLPMLENEQTLRNAIRAGLGLKLGDRVFFGGQELPTTGFEEAIVLRPEAIRPPSPPPPCPQGQHWDSIQGKCVDDTLQPPPLPPTPPDRFHHVRLKLNVPWDRLSELVRGVFTPLSREGAQITLDLDIQARSEKGISKSTLNLTIKETLNQIGAKVVGEETD
jgi:hypothetical protein